MFRAMIVDDEIMMRTALQNMIDWEKEGITLTGCYPDGQSALEALEKCPAELIFTDMRMPRCDGLQLIDRIHGMGLSPYIIVLSAFDEFSLVKQAFKKGAADYVLKQEISADRLKELLEEARKMIADVPEQETVRPAATDTGALFRDVIFRNAQPRQLPDLGSGYGIACFFLDEIDRQIDRFGDDVNASLTQPLTRLVRQMPQMKECDGFYSMDISRHFLFYSLSAPGRTREKAKSFFTRVQKAWKNYMNISCTVGIAFPDEDPEDEFYQVLERAEYNTTLRYVFGPGQVYDSDSCSLFDPIKIIKSSGRYMPFVQAVMNADFAEVEQYKRSLTGQISELPLEEGQSLVLRYLYKLYFEICFYDMQIAYKLGLEHRLYEKLHGICSRRDLIIYFSSVVRRIMEYFESHYDNSFPDPILKARRFVDDNYMRSDLTLRETADISGYNEKYFCTVFKKRFDVSFTDYVTQLRIQAARNLLEKTDLLNYEVGDAVGYNNPEHFIRMFKKNTGMTPTQYRKENVTKHQ